ncbi:MAG: hypothetical protein WKG07_06740 [Hymenobacter sp.]
MKNLALSLMIGAARFTGLGCLANRPPVSAASLRVRSTACRTLRAEAVKGNLYSSRQDFPLTKRRLLSGHRLWSR